MYVQDYLNDGAAWQAQMVLAYVRAHYLNVVEQTWSEKYHLHEVEISVGRYENCREQGYCFTIRIPDFMALDKQFHEKHWAVYEHRNSDNICVISSETHSINTPRWEQMFGADKGKYDYDKGFRYNEAFACGEYIIKEMEKYVTSNYSPVHQNEE